MVTVALQILLFPKLSMTVSTTLFTPTSSQKNALGSAEKKAILQLSVEGVARLSKSSAVRNASPFALSCNVMFWQLATGGVVSSTYTFAIQVLVFPESSETVSSTEIGVVDPLMV